MKGKIHKMVVRPDVMCGLETVAMMYTVEARDETGRGEEDVFGSS